MTPRPRKPSQPSLPSSPHTAPKRAPQSNACPAFFRALVYEARAGERSYADCGHELGNKIFSLVGQELGEEALGEFVLLVLKREPGAILQWLQARVPRMMALIPPRQYRSFMQGFMRAVEESGIDVDLSVAA